MSTKTTRRLLLLGTLGTALMSSACLKTPQFPLEVPARSAPVEERITAYERLAPRIVRGTEVVNYDSIGARRLEFVDSLELSDGTLIYSPEVLRQAILPNSESARLIDLYVDSKRRGHRLRWFGRAIGLMAIPLGVGAIVADDDMTSRALAWSSLGTFAAWIALRLVARSQGQRRERLQGLVFQQFDADLLDRLAVCRGQDGHYRGCLVQPAPTGVRLRAMP